MPLSTSKPVMDRLLAGVATGHARLVLARFMARTRQGGAGQERLLLEKIRRNAESAFGRAHGFAGIRGYADFIRQVPVLGYEYLSPYVERVKAGEVSAMFGPGRKVLMFAKTSGTTDVPKYVPVTREFLAEYRQGWNAFGVKALRDHPECLLRGIVQMSSPMDEERSTGGFPCGAITGIMAATQKRLVRRYYVVPPGVAYIGDATARYYTAMRFAVPRDVAFLVAASPATQLRLVKTAEEHALQLIRDLRDGTLWPALDIPREIRAGLEGLLRPDAQAARRLDDILERTGHLRPRDYWRLGFVANWTGGTMGLYLRNMPEYFGDTPVRDIGLLASEARMSIPVADGTPSGILDVASNFYEFIPAEEYESKSRPVLRAEEVEVGRDYFILLTTSAGFYRYDIGDRVRVTGFCGQAPLIEFLHKGLHTSSLTGEKLTEQQVVLAFEQAATRLDLPRANFVLAPQWGDPPYYRLHVEEGAAAGESARRRLIEAYEARLQAINIEYESKRKSARLGPVQLNVVPAGWLARWDQELSARRGRANEQYKHPYLLSRLGDDASFPAAAAAAPVG